VCLLIPERQRAGEKFGIIMREGIWGVEELKCIHAHGGSTVCISNSRSVDLHLAYNPVLEKVLRSITVVWLRSFKFVWHAGHFELLEWLMNLLYARSTISCPLQAQLSTLAKNH